MIENKACQYVKKGKVPENLFSKVKTLQECALLF